MKRDLASPLAPTYTPRITGGPKKKKKKPPTQPKGTWYDADDDTSNAPWTRPNKGSIPFVTSTSNPKKK